MYDRDLLLDMSNRINGRNVDFIKLDIGAGKNCKPGFISVDKEPSCDPEINHYVGSGFPIPIADECVDYVYTAHFMEHLNSDEYILAINDIWRILVVGGILEINVPYFTTRVAVQDPTHKMAFCETSFKFLDKENHIYRFYNNSAIECNFVVKYVNINGNDREHLMLKAVLIKKPWPKDINKPVDYTTDNCSTREDTQDEDLVASSENISTFKLIAENKGLFNVAAECAQVRSIHSKIAFNFMGKEGFTQEILNAHRKWIRVYAMTFSQEKIDIVQYRKNLFDLANYIIASLEALDIDIEKGYTSNIIKTLIDKSLEDIVSEGLSRSGSYPEGTSVNHKIF